MFSYYWEQYIHCFLVIRNNTSIVFLLLGTIHPLFSCYWEQYIHCFLVIGNNTSIVFLLLGTIHPLFSCYWEQYIHCFLVIGNNTSIFFLLFGTIHLLFSCYSEQYIYCFLVIRNNTSIVFLLFGTIHPLFSCYLGTIHPLFSCHSRYSYDYGLVHMIMMSTEHDFSPGSTQYTWLENDLKKVDRKVTPWVFIGGHRAMYCSEIIHSNCIFFFFAFFCLIVSE